MVLKLRSCRSPDGIRNELRLAHERAVPGIAPDNVKLDICASKQTLLRRQRKRIVLLAHDVGARDILPSRIRDFRPEGLVRVRLQLLCQPAGRSSVDVVVEYFFWVGWVYVVTLTKRPSALHTRSSEGVQHYSLSGSIPTSIFSQGSG